MNIDLSNYLDKFKVHKRQTLFDLDFNTLKNSATQDRCPYCGRKLKLTLNRRMKYCNNKRVHAEQFKLTPKGSRNLTK